MRRRILALFCVGWLIFGVSCQVVGTPAPATRAPAARSASAATPTATPRLTATARPSATPTATVEPSPTPSPRPVRSPTLTPTVRAASSATAAPAPAPSPTPPSDALSPPVTWEQEIQLNTYGWEQALVPTAPDDPIHPYPRLDFDALAPPAPRTYRAVFLQNAYVQLVVVPELGGRILRWTDRVTERQLFYANPVIKPTRWGYRGWWLATGGMEWAFPTEEHGLNEYRPWQYERLWNGVRVWDTDDRTGLRVEVTITLDQAHSYFTVSPRITNPTDQPQPYQFWANAMLTLSDTNAPSPALRFILPDDSVTVHSTADGSLPAPGAQMAWPVHNGRDFSRYGEWQQYLGVFADPAQAGFVGAYDPTHEQGVVRVFPHEIATGVKFFCLGDLPADLWTDDGSRYFELWGGVTPTFWDYWTLDPGASVAWSERWYAVSGIGGYNWANDAAAIRLTPGGSRAEVAVVTTRALDGTLVLRRGGVEVARWDARLGPARPFVAAEETALEGVWGVWVYADGDVIAQMGP